MSISDKDELKMIEDAMTFWVSLQYDVSTHVTYCERQMTFDRTYVTRRAFNEGMPFLALTLAMYTSAIEEGLETGLFICPLAFEKRGVHLPRLFNSIIRRIFDVQSGEILTDACGSDIRALRQLTKTFKKFEADLDSAAVARQVRTLCEVDSSLPSKGEWGHEAEVFIGVARSIVASIFSSTSPATISGRPGPGTDSYHSRHEERFQPRVRYSDIERSYSYKDSFYWNEHHFNDRLREYMCLPVKSTGHSVLSPVPKSFGVCRFVCMFPHEYMWHQQGLGDWMRISFRDNKYTRYSLPLNDQTINANRALQSSITRENATIDMSEASDRISRELVESLFADVPELLSCMLSLSPRWMRLPCKNPLNNRGILEPRMFAPMGSSLCFPTMSVVHFSLVLAIVAVTHRISPAQVAKHLTVYGDDIIVPSKWAQCVFDKLPLFGMKLNRTKSFVNGHFRESCGIDAFKGVDVTPVYVKRRELLRANSGRELKAVLDTEYRLRKNGYYSAAIVLRKTVESQHGVLPYVAAGSRFVGWYHDCGTFISRQINGSFAKRSTSSRNVRVREFYISPFASMVGGWERLIRFYSIGNAAQGLSARNPNVDIRWATVNVLELQTLKSGYIRSLETRLGIRT